jgi:hypothetical protein
MSTWRRKPTSESCKGEGERDQGESDKAAHPNHQRRTSNSSSRGLVRNLGM